MRRGAWDGLIQLPVASGISTTWQNQPTYSSPEALPPRNAGGEGHS